MKKCIEINNYNENRKRMALQLEQATNNLVFLRMQKNLNINIRR